MSTITVICCESSTGPVSKHEECKSDDPEFKYACKFASRQLENIESLRDPSFCPPKKKRAFGGGRKVKAPEVREGLFAWFVDVRSSFRGRIPKSTFKMKAHQLNDAYCNANDIPSDAQLKFGNQWLKGQEEEYGVSLRKPNKRYSIKKEDLVERLEDYLKNVWSVRIYFIEKYKVDPPIINGDQMPLHRNEVAEQKTLAFKNREDYVKENHMLSRERVTVFTQESSEKDSEYLPEFVFKGVGSRTRIEVSPEVK